MAEPTSGARPSASKRPTPRPSTAKRASGPPARDRQLVASTATPATPLTADGSRWSLAYRSTAVVLVLAAFVLLLRMTNQERGGPAHAEMSIGRGIPATLYLPVDADDDGDLPEPPPVGQRPPVVVMAHGYSADRASMSGLARSLAEAGYAVLSIDLRGHGANTHPFRGDLRDDFATAVRWATTSPYVDGERLAVLGHSMGAGAALDFATLDDRPSAVIPLSGGWVANDQVVPAHTLFLVGSGDPDRIRDNQGALAATLEAAGGDVRFHEIDGANHITILRDSETVGRIVTFLDPILEPAAAKTRGDATPGLVDPRLRTAAFYLLVVIGLVALLGLAMGQVVPAPATAGGSAGTDRPPWAGLALTAGALALTLPLEAAGRFDLFPLGAGQPVVMHLALASAVLWGGRSLARRGQLGGRLSGWLGDGQWLPLRTAGWPGLAAAGVIVMLLVPLSGVFHRLVPTPQRAFYWVALSLITLPFFAAFEALVRRGPTNRATATGIAGKILLLVMLYVGFGIGALPSVILLIAPLLFVQYALLEVFAATCYARGRNTALIAVVEAVFVAFLVTALTPVG